jgi:hypothetical protein
MDIFEIKNIKKPYLTDRKVLEDMIEYSKKSITISEPTIVEKFYIKIKNNIYYIIENNICLIFYIIIIICLLIFRFFQYQNIKKKSNNNNKYI